ncbi:hypothetical protein [Actinomadura sp. 9N215]|uniref:hypothetical protein n=1 Tax=Actinomadura sp. 9N215 TaxID=3375150 RepID=UPI00378BF88D
MRDLYRPARPVARLLVVALGLLGIVVGPAGAGTHGGTSPTGTITGARTGAAVHHAPGRTRGSVKQRPAPRTQAAHGGPLTRAFVVAGAVPDAHPAPAAEPSRAGLPHFVAHPSFVHSSVAVLPASGIDLRPPSWRVVRAVPGRVAADVATRGVPRGRAPPTSPRI